MTADQIMRNPALSRYVGSSLESTARLIADAAASSTEDRNRRREVAPLAGMLAADINASEYIPAILMAIEAAWLAGYRVGTVDGMIGAALAPDVPPFLAHRVNGGQ